MDKNNLRRRVGGTLAPGAIFLKRMTLGASVMAEFHQVGRRLRSWGPTAAAAGFGPHDHSR